MSSHVTVDRWQFTLTVMFHYLFPILTMGLSLFIVWLESVAFMPNRPTSMSDSVGRHGRRKSLRPDAPSRDDPARTGLGALGASRRRGIDGPGGPGTYSTAGVRPRGCGYSIIRSRTRCGTPSVTGSPSSCSSGSWSGWSCVQTPVASTRAVSRARLADTSSR